MKTRYNPWGCGKRGKTMRIVLVMLVVFALFTVPLAFAEVKDKGFENRHTVRIATRSDDDDYNLYLTRLAAFVDYESTLFKRIIRISPFFEYQHEIEANTWWRKELGVEIGTSFFDDFFYLGASFQHVWQQQENYTVEDLQETTEWESRFVITPPLKWWLFKDKLTLKLFNEYTYDFTRGQGTINEIGVSLDWQVHEGLKLPLGWRHIDRIHDFDQDYLEFAVEFSF